MKKIELELSAISHTGDKDYEYHINTILGVLRELVNAHNELLDTHTVKEEGEMIRCEHGLIAGDECDCGKGYQKEEPTTPEKNDYSPRPQGDSWKDGVKPQNASYEVTCGRCEKSIKHSCGAVK